MGLWRASVSANWLATPPIRSLSPGLVISFLFSEPLNAANELPIMPGAHLPKGHRAASAVGRKSEEPHRANGRAGDRDARVRVRSGRSTKFEPGAGTPAGDAREQVARALQAAALAPSRAAPLET